jgi:hypothetical protein
VHHCAQPLDDTTAIYRQLLNVLRVRFAAICNTVYRDDENVESFARRSRGVVAITREIFVRSLAKPATHLSNSA